MIRGVSRQREQPATAEARLRQCVCLSRLGSTQDLLPEGVAAEAASAAPWGVAMQRGYSAAPRLSPPRALAYSQPPS